MNSDEAIAQKYLKTLGVVAYEPDGNFPPDFVVDEGIGVEVRRLNQNHRNQFTVKGLEAAGIPFIAALERELATYPAGSEKKYWMRLRYQLPFGKISIVKKALKEAFIDFEAKLERTPASYKLSSNVEIEILVEAWNTTKKYSLAVFNDYDSGGLVVDMYSTEINHCASEKAAKVAPYSKNYAVWWLLLVDHLGFMDPESLSKTLELIIKPNIFQRITVINAQSELRFEI
jgi:hypothetical protein